MITIVAAAMLAGIAAGVAQDIAGVEDCTKTQGLDKRTGCMQSNINFLQRTMTRNAADANRRLQAAETELVALRSAVVALRKQVDELQAAKSAADKSAADKKAEPKKTNDRKAEEKKM
jgi:hypothetical protein